MVQRATRTSPFTLPIQRGFTLVELLVVIAIIAILIGLSVVIATKVSGSGKQRQTEQTLRLLDSVLSTYITATGGNPPPLVGHPWGRTGSAMLPVADGQNALFIDSGSQPPGPTINNSVGLFVLQCQSVPGAAAALKDLDPKILREYDPLSAQGRSLVPRPTQLILDPPPPSSFPLALTVVPPLNTVMDGWNHPIRYVHPIFKGIVVDGDPATSADPRKLEELMGRPPTGKGYGFNLVRRQLGVDADCGIPSDNRPYFYSCGPDGDPTTIEDNIYFTRPKFPKN